MASLDALSPHQMHIQSSFAPIGQVALQAIQQVQQSQLQQLQQMGMTQAAEIMSQSMSRFHDFAHGEAARKIEALRNKISTLFQDNEIVAVTNVGDMQNAPDQMLDYIMAVPMVAEMYANNELNGYNGRYENPQPGYFGDDSHAYRNMMNGMIYKVESDEGDYHAAKSYWESQNHRDELTFHQRTDIHQTMENVISMIENGAVDPTSEFNDLL